MFYHCAAHDTTQGIQNVVLSCRPLSSIKIIVRICDSESIELEYIRFIFASDGPGAGGMP